MAIGERSNRPQSASRQTQASRSRRDSLVVSRRRPLRHTTRRRRPPETGVDPDLAGGGPELARRATWTSGSCDVAVVGVRIRRGVAVIDVGEGPLDQHLERTADRRREGRVGPDDPPSRVLEHRRRERTPHERLERLFGPGFDRLGLTCRRRGHRIHRSSAPASGHAAFMPAGFPGPRLSSLSREQQWTASGAPGSLLATASSFTSFSTEIVPPATSSSVKLEFHSHG